MAFPAVGDPGTDTVSPPNDWASKLLAALATGMDTNGNLVSSYVKLGTNPASAGAVRIANADWIAARNAANGGDVNLIRINSSNQLEFGASIGGLTAATALTVADFTSVATAYDRVSLANTMWNPGSGRTTSIRSTITGKGLSTVASGAIAGRFTAQDHSGVNIKTITNVTRVGTTVTVTAAGHGYADNDKIQVYDVTHTFNQEVNGEWTISNVTTNTFDYTVSSLSSGSYTSGGSVTNRPYLGALLLEVSPRVARNIGSRAAQHAEDAVGVAIQNISGVSTAKATDAFYVAASPSISGDAWTTAFNNDANVQIGYRLAGTISVAGLDFTAATFGAASAMRLPNNIWITTRNAANSSDLSTIKVNASDLIEFGIGLQLTDATNVAVGSTTGTKIGTATTQKIAFFNSTPIVQPANTTDLRTALINLGLYASGGASPLDLNGGTLTGAKGVFGTSAATTGALNLPNNSSLYCRNAANNTDLAVFRLTTSDQFQLQTTLNFADSVNIVLGTTNGTQLGAAANQKLSFHGATAVVQHATTGETVGFTAGGGTTVTDASTFTGNVGATAYRISDIVKALKNKGLMAA